MTGIAAIQAPMRELYMPYRMGERLAQEQILCVSPDGVVIYYLAGGDDDEPTSYTLPWDDIIYIEPLKFSSGRYDLVLEKFRVTVVCLVKDVIYPFHCRVHKDKKTVSAAFEPCEMQRLAMLGDRNSLYVPLSKQFKHLSLRKHPALMCMVVRDPHVVNEFYAHAYICSTVDESVSFIVNFSIVILWSS